MRKLKEATPDINLTELYNRESGDTSLLVNIQNSQDSYIIVDGVKVLDPLSRVLLITQLDLTSVMTIY